MQQLMLHKRFYQVNKIYERLESDSKQPQNLRKPKWKLSEMQKILALRRKNPLYGKAKITVLLKRDHGINLSESTVGRIIAYYIKRDQIKPACFYYKNLDSSNKCKI